MEPKNISPLSSISLILIAVVGDSVQFFTKFFHAIPVIGNTLAVVIGWLITLTVLIIIWLWFALIGVPLLARLNRMLITMFTPIIELIPLINAVPALTLSVILTIWLVRREYAQYNKNKGSQPKIESYES